MTLMFWSLSVCISLFISIMFQYLILKLFLFLGYSNLRLQEEACFFFKYLAWRLSASVLGTHLLWPCLYLWNAVAVATEALVPLQCHYQRLNSVDFRKIRNTCIICSLDISKHHSITSRCLVGHTVDWGYVLIDRGPVWLYIQFNIYKYLLLLIFWLLKLFLLSVLTVKTLPSNVVSM